MKKLFIFLHFVLLILSYSPILNYWISPSEFPYFQYTALAFPILVVLDVLFIFFWFLTQIRVGLFFLALSLPLYFLIQPIYKFPQSTNPKQGKYKLITYNLRNLSGDSKKLQHWVLKQNPDLFFTQEHSKPKVDKKLKVLFPFQEEYKNVAVFSKFPIVETYEISSEKIKRACYADIKIDSDTIRFLNIHLYSFKIDNKFMKGFLKKDQLEQQASTIEIKLEGNFKTHQKQIDTILPFIQDSPHPVVVVGDFNSVPNSYEYFQFNSFLRDTFLEVGNGFGFTFDAFHYPIRIDYVFTSNTIEPTSYIIPQVNYSDHKPVIVEFNLPSQ